MKFYFCESCNKRITDADLATGSARDKKVKGVFCKDCAVSVSTMEFEALSETEARELVPNAPAPKSSQRAAVRTSEKSQRAPRSAGADSARLAERSRSGSPNATKWVLIAVAVGIAAGLFAFMIFFSDSSANAPAGGKVTLPEKSNSTPAPSNSSPPVAQTAPVAPAVPIAPAAPPVRVVAPPLPTATLVQIPAHAEEDAVSKAFDVASRKINALPEDNLSERIKLAETFVKDYPESMEAARMRVKIHDWSTPKVSAAPAAPANSPPADAGAAPDEKQTRILFSCTPATDEGLKSYSTGQHEAAEVFGVQSQVWRAEKIPDPPWHSTQMHIAISAHAGAPVKISAGTWVRFACRLESTRHLMLHSIIGKGIYEIHLNNQPENKWFWVTFKMTDFTRDIKGGAPRPPAASEFYDLAIMAGDNKIPCTLLVEKLQIGEGPLPNQ